MIGKRVLCFAMLAVACAKTPESEPARASQIAVPSAKPEPESARNPPSATEASLTPPAFTLERLPRTVRAGRQLSLLVPEVEGLEKLLAATPEGSRDRPTLVRRLGIVYFELFLAQLAERADTKAALLGAEKHLSDVAEWLQSLPNELYVFGLVREQLGNLRSAAEIYEAVLKAPNLQGDVDARAHYGLGLIAELRGEDAKPEYARARDLLLTLGHERDADLTLRSEIDEKLKTAR